MANPEIMIERKQVLNNLISIRTLAEVQQNGSLFDTALSAAKSRNRISCDFLGLWTDAKV